MVSWQTIQSLLIFFGPFLLSRGLQYYRSIKSTPQSRIQPLPKATSYALGILFLSGVVAFLSTFPLFAEENVFRATKSRLGTSVGVLFARLGAIRELGVRDEKLREVLERGGLEGKLLYAQFGGRVLVESPLGNGARELLIYSLPSILAPHLLHLLAIGIATSPLLAGKSASQWRTTATIAALAIAAIEIYAISNHDTKTNARSTRHNDISFPHWQRPLYRGLAISLLDSILGLILYLQSTGRAFFAPPSAQDRVLDHAAHLEKLLARVRGLGVIKNGVAREGSLRGKVEDYWVKEGEVMRSVFEEPEVLEAQRNALRRLDGVRVGRDAEGFVDGILGAEPAPPAVPPHAPGTIGL